MNLLWIDVLTPYICPDGEANGPVANHIFLGRATLLGQREPKIVRDGVALWEADPVDDIIIHDGGDLFGIEFRFPHKRTLDIGRVYEFTVPLQDGPSFITVNDSICWRREELDFGPEPVTIRFEWVADAPTAVLRLWSANADSRIFFGAHVPLAVRPTELRHDGEPPLQKYAVPPTIHRYPVPAIYAQWLSDHAGLVSWPDPIPDVAWHTDSVGIIIDLGGWMELSIPCQARNIQHFLRCHEFGKVGINGIFYYGNGWPPQTFGSWGFLPNVPASGDVTSTEMDAFVIENGIEHVILESCQLGEWNAGDPFAFPSGYSPRAKLYESLDTGLILQTRYPHLKVYFWIAEMRLQGVLDDERARIDPGDDPEGARLYGTGGCDQLYDYWNKNDKLLDAYADWHAKMRAALPDPARALVAMQSHTPWDCAVIAKAGVDVVDTKGIHRQCVQAVVAAGRGTSRHTGLQFQGELDSWLWAAYNTYGPDEVEQMYRMYFAAGCDSIYAQADLFGIDDNHCVLPNKLGAAALRAVRWMRIHPKRGRQVVPFALLVGDACTIAWGPSVIGDCWYSPRKPPYRPEHEDFELMSCFLPKMGHWWRGDYAHVFTGAPFGPVDIAPAQFAFGSLADYRVVVMAGWHGMTSEQYALVEAYVSQGGVFVSALGHLKVRGERDWMNGGRAPAAETSACFGVALDASGQPTLIDASVVVSTDDGQPLVSRKGSAYLVWRELCQDSRRPDESRAIREVISSLVVEHRAVEFNPTSDYLEAAITARDGLLMVHVFNHAAIRQPSGLGPDPTPYVGVVSIDLSMVPCHSTELEVMQLTDNMRLVPLEWRVDHSSLSIPITLTSSHEYIIGPAGEIESRLFR